MKHFKIINNGVSYIDWLVNKYRVLEVNDANIEQLKDEVYESFINDPLTDFSTNGGCSVTIVDIENCAICEIYYDWRY